MEGGFVVSVGVGQGWRGMRSGCRLVEGRRSGVVVMRRRSVVMMGKKMRKVEDDAADDYQVFQAVGDSEDLLSAALAENDTQNTKKNKKKGKKGAVEPEEVPVFTEVAEGEDLLAAALAEEPQQSKKSKKKQKKGAIEVEEVPVFAEVAEGEDLLAAALSENDADKQGKSKKNKGKKGAAEVEEIPVFTEVAEGEDLLAAALAEEPQSNKKKGKKGGKHAVHDEEVVPDLTMSEESGVTAVQEDPEVEEEEETGNGVIVSEDETSSGNGVAADEEEESTGPAEDLDNEVVEEMESLAMDVEDFTMRGVKKRAQIVRKGAVERTGGEKFVFVRLEEVAQTFKNADVLKSVTWEVKTGDRIGLVGQNGSGKTTQLKIIAGQLEPTKGEVIRSSNRMRCSFLRQEFVDELNLEATLREEFQTAFIEESKLLQRYEEVEGELGSAGEDMEKMESLLNEMEELRLQLDSMDAWNLDSRVDKLLPVLGFEQIDLDSTVGSFSGGWKVRIGLGKILLQNPDLLLLDEPTNHLDLDSVEWLESFLQSIDLPMVIVSHDREFMDRLCTKIVETEGGEAFEYRGNYTDFVKQKKERREQWQAAYDKQQKFVDEQRSFIRRFRSSSARSAQVKSREKMLQKLEQGVDWVRQPPRGKKPFVFRFPPAPRSGRDVCIVDEVSHGYDGKLLFKNASFVLERGDRIAILGPNGSGKSTLLRLALGDEKALKGETECRELHGVVPAYFAQNQADALDLEKTVLETVSEAQNGELIYEEIRAILGKFLFKGEAVDKKIKALSGGEKARVALCKMMVSPANFLILDEPTNHLDIPAKEMLEEAIQEFDGTVLVVSHDRYFVSRVAKQILAVEDGEVVLYDGDYRSYMEKHDRLLEKLKGRQIDGLTEIRSAPVIEYRAAEEQKVKKKKKNFGGSGIKSGKTKEMNAKRWSK